MIHLISTTCYAGNALCSSVERTVAVISDLLQQQPLIRTFVFILATPSPLTSDLFAVVIFFMSSPSDDLINWNSRSFCPSVRPSTKKFFRFRSNLVCRKTSTAHAHKYDRSDPRSRSRLRSFCSSENCTFLRLSPPPFWRGAQN